MDIYSYFTDGAATMANKNGKYLRKEGGWAFIMCLNGERHSVQSGGCAKTTNNEMEGWERRGWRKSDGKPIENLTLIKAIWKLMGDIEDKGCELLFVKVKGHSNNVLNNEADKLAVEAKVNAKKTGRTIGYDNKPDPLLGTK